MKPASRAGRGIFNCKFDVAGEDDLGAAVEVGVGDGFSGTGVDVGAAVGVAVWDSDGVGFDVVAEFTVNVAAFEDGDVSGAGALSVTLQVTV